ncbi:MAG: signal peptidase I [Clostridia bacterium]|nr:signal peptidase I [Clostridia bacterium]
MKKLVKIWNVFTTLLVVFMMLMAVLLVGVRLIGLTPFTVLSGSMEPAYHVGSLIYVKETKPEKIEVGDAITYVVNEDLLVSTHRVVDIDVFYTTTKAVLDENEQPVLDENGDPMYEEVELEEPSYYFTTKGDANDAVDGTPVYYKNVLGVPVFSIPLLGFLSSWLQTRQGMIMGISIALVIIILTFLPDLLKMVDEPDKKKAEEKPAEEGQETEQSEEA